MDFKKKKKTESPEFYSLLSCHFYSYYNCKKLFHLIHLSLLKHEQQISDELQDTAHTFSTTRATSVKSSATCFYENYIC